MTSKRENILARILTIVTPTTGISNRAYRDRVVALTRAETPSILIEGVSDSAEQNTSLPTLDWSLTVRCSVIVRSSTPITTSDATVVNMHSRIMADLTLNGYAIDVQPGNVDIQTIDSDQPTGVIACEYLVRYRTEINDLSQ
tara:strand:- start:306 stop:731 length:426 start_codon:yes stop_codon:yes gene_type:complete